MGRIPVSLLSALFLLGLPALGPAQATAGSVTLTGRVLGRVMGRAPGLAPPAGTYQEIAFFRMRGGGIAVLIHRFQSASDRLPRKFWNPHPVRSIAGTPAATCAAHLRVLVYRQFTGRDGTGLTKPAVALMPGVSMATILPHLADAPTCYVISGGSQ